MSSVGRRLSRKEVEALLQEFATSGLRQREFCAHRGVGLSTLSHYLRRSRAERGDVPQPRLIAVELSPAESGEVNNSAKLADRGIEHSRATPSMESAVGVDTGLVVVLHGGRRIEVRCGFDGGVLRQLIAVLEQA